MRIMVTGATGWIGSAIVQELIASGHAVVGLVRSPGDTARVEGLGAEPLIGSIDDVALLTSAAQGSDGVIHTAMGSGFDNQEKPIRDDVRAIETFGDAFAGSDRPIIVTHGLGNLPPGEIFTEEARPGIIAEYPRASEQTAFTLAERGIRASVVRPARSVHGVGERHGFVSLLAAVARKRGFSAFVGDGNGPWPACHRRDVARVYRLAVERGARGEAYHAVAEAVPFRRVAEAIGRQLGLPVRSIPATEAKAHFGDLALWVVGGGDVATDLTRKWLGWQPTEIDFLADIDRPEYFAGVRDED